MAEFEKTRWADSDFSKMYREGADIYMPFRRRFIEVTKSIFSYFLKDRSEIKALDLGCGDGFFAEELLKSFSTVNITLSDGSDDMLKAAQKRLKGRSNVEYLKGSFQNIIDSNILKGHFDFIYSSFAIHHLPLADKKRLYSKIYNMLTPGGCFVHNDVVAPLSARIENWYLRLWREWIDQFPDKTVSAGMDAIPEKYKESPDDFPDSLETHLDILRKTGFIDVDCFLKYGIFALFGGFKLKN